MTIDVDGNGPVEVVVAHLSYDKKQQCNNVVDIMNHLAASETVDINTSPGGAVEDPSTQTNKAGKGTFIVVGDLNVYNDDSAAVDLLQSAAGSEGNRCAVEAAELTPSWVGSKSKPAGKRKTFDDAWLLGEQIPACCCCWPYTWMRAHTPGCTRTPRSYINGRTQLLDSKHVVLMIVCVLMPPVETAVYLLTRTNTRCNLKAAPRPTKKRKKKSCRRPQLLPRQAGARSKSSSTCLAKRSARIPSRTCLPLVSYVHYI